MNRPRLFLSAVTGELRDARNVVASAVRTLGFDAVSQEEFPTGHGELRQWLREQIDASEGLIQLVGHAYGAEPPTADPDHGRVSYTQFEFLYASQRRKKTWVVVIGNDYPRDHALEQLDRPPDSVHPDPPGYQAERRALQQSYVARLTADNHLRHTANNPTELQNIILRLRDGLGELREQSERQRRHLTGAMAAILIALLLLIAGGWWGYQHLHRAVRQTAEVNTERLRAHLSQTVDDTHRRELAEADRAGDWKERQRLREAADAIHATRLTRIAELAASFAEIEGSGRTTDVFRELTRILTEQGVDEAIAYMNGQSPSILQTVRTRAAASRERNRADLRPLLQVAALHEAKAQILEARSLYNDILSVEPDWPEGLRAVFWFHVRQGDTSMTHGSLQGATRNYEEADRLIRRLTASDPGNTEWRRDLAVTYDKLGDVDVAQGQLVEAASAHREALAIRKVLTAGDPRNAQWQGDLAVSHTKLADVAVAQGQLAEAASAHREALTIRKALTARDPGNAQWQRDLSVSYNRLGSLAVAQGELAEAARAYSDDLAIAKRLAAGDRRNTQWQRDLAISYDNLGDVAVAQRKFPDAARAYGDALTIRKTLTAGDRSHAQWQGELSVSYTKLGDVAVAQGQLAEAERAHRDALAIARTLATRDPSNTQWQRDLAVACDRLGDVAERQSKTAESIAYFKEAFQVLSGIEARGLHLSPEDRQWLQRLRERVAAPGRELWQAVGPGVTRRAVDNA